MIFETQDLNLIYELESRIPEFESPYTLEYIQDRVKNRKFLALVAQNDGENVGYKVGYEESRSRFYSWIGGVLPSHRRQGWARMMLRAQEDWCLRQGYRELNVWSENQYRSMLIFLLTENYDVYATAGDGKILMRKVLQNNGYG